MTCVTPERKGQRTAAHARRRPWAPDLMVRPLEDPDSVDPTKQSGRPFFLVGVLVLIVIVLSVLVIIGSQVG